MPPPPPESEDSLSGEIAGSVESEDTVKVMPESSPKESDSVKVVSSDVKGGIKVVALRNGFFQGARKAEGDEFTVPNLKKAGSWVRCLDPQLEKEHLVMLKEIKKAGN